MMSAATSKVCVAERNLSSARAVETHYGLVNTMVDDAYNLDAKNAHRAGESWPQGDRQPEPGGRTALKTTSGGDTLQAIRSIRQTAAIYRDRVTGELSADPIGATQTPAHLRESGSGMLAGLLPPSYPEWLGDRSFQELHGCRFNYVCGEMAQRISTPRMVVEAVRNGLMGFYGSAGLALSVIENDINEIKAAVGGKRNWGANLISQPQNLEKEMAFADLFVRLGVNRVSASAFTKMSPSIVRLAAAGLWQDERGEIHRRNFIFAKVSRPEVAALFMSPAPEELLRKLVVDGRLSAKEAELASRIPVAEDITVEADSGGHTDNRPLVGLFPAIAKQRDDLVARFGYDRDIRLGAAGGLGTPSAVAAAFQLGAAYVVLGSVNQSAVESGLSPVGRRMLAEADIADVMMAPSADMFELGIKVQVLKRGTIFAARANRLYEIYRKHQSFDDISPRDRDWLETQVFRMTIEEAWVETRSYHAKRQSGKDEKGGQDAKYLMALVFRRFLFMGSQWAREGEHDRKVDFQIWCGPAMGSFNQWVKGSFLEDPDNRGVAQIAKNLLEGAAVIQRAQQFRSLGLPVPPSAFEFRPCRIN